MHPRHGRDRRLDRMPRPRLVGRPAARVGTRELARLRPRRANRIPWLSFFTLAVTAAALVATAPLSGEDGGCQRDLASYHASSAITLTPAFLSHVVLLIERMAAASAFALTTCRGITLD